MPTPKGMNDLVSHYGPAEGKNPAQEGHRTADPRERPSRSPLDELMSEPDEGVDRFSSPQPRGNDVPCSTISSSLATGREYGALQEEERGDCPPSRRALELTDGFVLTVAGDYRTSPGPQNGACDAELPTERVNNEAQYSHNTVVQGEAMKEQCAAYSPATAPERPGQVGLPDVLSEPGQEMGLSGGLKDDTAARDADPGCRSYRNEPEARPDASGYADAQRREARDCRAGQPAHSHASQDTTRDHGEFHPRREGLVDPGELRFAPVQEPGGAEKVASRSKVLLTSAMDILGKLLQRARPLLIPAVMLLAAVILLYPSNPKPYTVETKLLFLTRDGGTPGSTGWSLEKEARYFNNTNILYASAQQLFQPRTENTNAVSDRNRQGTNPNSPARRRVLADGKDRLTTSGEFIKWFLNASSMETDYSGVPARITLRLSGKDPDFLKSVSENYVRSYVDYRQSLASQVVKENKAEERPNEISPKQAALREINENIKKCELSEREYNLALKLIDSGKSSFSGFIPKENMVDAGTLTHFQQKIVQLELQKNSLRLRFAPDSREVRTVDQDIQAARKAMRQCVVEQQRFVKQNRETLLTEKAELEKASAPTGPRSAPVKQVATSKALTPDTPIFLNDGLYLIWDPTSVVDGPLFSSAGAFKGSIVGRFQQSLGSMREFKDAMVTGLYRNLVSESAKASDNYAQDDHAQDRNTSRKGL